MRNKQEAVTDFQDIDKEIEQLGIDYKPTKFID